MPSAGKCGLLTTVPPGKSLDWSVLISKLIKLYTLNKYSTLYVSWVSLVVLAVKNPPANESRCKRHGFDP